jgi:hypothetical protein
MALAVQQIYPVAHLPLVRAQLQAALSTCARIELNCHLIWEVIRNSPGGDNDVA